MLATLDAVYVTISDPVFRGVVAVVGANLILSAVDHWRSGGVWARP